MTSFNILPTLITLALLILCFWLPYKSGKKLTGIITSIVLLLILTWLLFGQLEFLVIVIWPTVIAFQIVFLSYWSFRVFNRKNLGIIASSVLTLVFILIAMSPWISDWIFSKKDAQKILSWHNVELIDDFEILENESGGFTDYVQTFTLKISESDYQKIAEAIRNSQNFSGLITDFKTKLPTINHTSYDTINYENKNYIEREYYTKEKMDDGTYHFVLKLSKKNRELNYFGINE